MNRDLRLLFADRVNILLAAVPNVLYIILYATSMQGMIPELEYSGKIVQYATFVFPGLTFFTVLGAAAQVGASSYSEMSSGYAQEIWSMPVRSLGYLAGKFTAIVVYLALQLAPMTFFGALILHIRARATNWQLFSLCLVLSACCVVALYMMIGLFLRTQQQFMIVMNLLGPVLTMTAPLFYRPQDAPHWMRIMMPLNPLTHSINSTRDALVFGHASASSLASLGILLVIELFVITFLLNRRRKRL